jgi:hypothetical protein
MIHLTRVLLVWRLLLENSSRLARIALFSVPVTMLLAVWISLSLDGMVQMYSQRLEFSYSGMQGRLTLQSDPVAIARVRDVAKKQNIKLYPRHDQSSLIQLRTINNEIILKFVTLVIFENSSFYERFPQSDNSSLLVNQIFYQQLGLYKDKLLSIKGKEARSWLPISKLYSQDTGFLTNKALLFLPVSQYEILFESKFRGYSRLEFAQVNSVNVNISKSWVAMLFAEENLGSYQLHDILLDTADSQQQFSKLRMAQQGLLVFILILSALTITQAVKLLLVLKVKALSVANHLGVARFDISNALISGCVSAILITSWLAFFLHQTTFPMIVDFFDIKQEIYLVTDPLLYVLIVFLCIIIAFNAWDNTRKAVIPTP